MVKVPAMKSFAERPFRAAAETIEAVAEQAPRVDWTSKAPDQLRAQEEVLSAAEHAATEARAGLTMIDGLADHLGWEHAVVNQLSGARHDLGSIITYVAGDSAASTSANVQFLQGARHPGFSGSVPMMAHSMKELQVPRLKAMDEAVTKTLREALPQGG